MDFRVSGVRSLKLNIFLILKEVKTNLTLRSVSQDHSIFKRVRQAANHPLSLFIPRAGTAAAIYGRGQTSNQASKVSVLKVHLLIVSFLDIT